MFYLSTSKVAIAVLGNFAFAVALCTYFLLTKASLYHSEHHFTGAGLYCASMAEFACSDRGGQQQGG